MKLFDTRVRYGADPEMMTPTGKAAVTTPAVRGASREAQFLRLVAKGGVVAYLLILVIAFGMANSAFLDWRTLLAVVSVSTPLMVVAAGMTMCLICAEVDLSVVGVVGLSSTITALLLFNGIPWPMALLAAVAAGTAVGMVNGLLAGQLVSVMPFFPSFFPTLVTALALGIAESLLPSKQAIAISDPAFESIFGRINRPCGDLVAILEPAKWRVRSDTRLLSRCSQRGCTAWPFLGSRRRSAELLFQRPAKVHHLVDHRRVLGSRLLRRPTPHHSRRRDPHTLGRSFEL